MEGDLQLLPKRPCPVKQNAFPNKIKLITNHYSISLKESTDLYQFSLDTEPSIPDDSIQLLREVVNSIKEPLVTAIDIISHKGKIIWGIKSLEKPLILNTKVKEIGYEVILRQSRVFYESEIAKLEGLALKRVLQVYSVAMKQKIVRMGLKQILKGKYFRIKANQNQEILMNEIGIKILRTYELRLVPIMKGISLQIDVGSRILRTQNMLETLNKCRSIDEKRIFIGCNVQCNYGNRNSYRIVDIIFNKTPLSEFNQQKMQRSVSYVKYYYQQYNIKIKELKQPLIQVVTHVNQFHKEGKREKQEIKGFLIPQLVRLVGIPEEIRKDQSILRKIADFTKIVPSKRCELSYNIINEFNKEKGNMIIEKAIEVDGYVLPNPNYITSFERTAQNGSINIKEKLKDPMRLRKDNWLLVMSSLSKEYQKDDKYDAEDIIKGFKTAQSVYGINIEDPILVTIYKDNVEQWKKSISSSIKDSCIVMLFFTNRQSRYYDELKRFLINDLKVASQAVLRKQLRGKGVLSVLSKVICQMNAKLGKALWQITPKHPFWKNRSFTYGGLSLSRGPKGGHTLAFVGTYSRDLTKVYSSSRTNLPSREEIPDKTYEQIFVDWIKKYNEYEKQFPSIIILYRQGLSEEQAKIQGQKELKALFRVVERANKKLAGYNPQIIYIIVNKRVNTRFYLTGNNNERGGKFRPLIENPAPGSIIFEPLSSQNAYDFHLVAQKVTQGTCTPTHYRIAYDASQIPQEAISQFTYEQCYNYYNWFGAVRVPSCLQNADKLSRLVGQHIRQNIASSDLLKTPFFL